jgi:hypothetical protein
MKRPKTVRTSVDIPEPLHRELRAAAARRGCSARQLVLERIARVVSESAPAPAPARRRGRLSLDPPIVPSTGKPFDLSEEQIYELIEFP